MYNATLYIPADTYEISSVTIESHDEILYDINVRVAGARSITTCLYSTRVSAIFLLRSIACSIVVAIAVCFVHSMVHSRVASGVSRSTCPMCIRSTTSPHYVPQESIDTRAKTEGNRSITRTRASAACQPALAYVPTKTNLPHLTLTPWP